MNKIKPIRLLAGIAMAITSTALCAEDASNKYFVGAALLNVQGSAEALTNNSLGYNLNAGIEFALQDGLAFRTTASINLLPGKGKDGLEFGLRGYQIAGDLVYPSPIHNVDLLFGLSVQRWQYRLSIADGVDNPYVSQTTGAVVWPASSCYTFVPGTKLGFRLGAEYAVNAHVRIEGLIQQTEMGSINGDPSFFNKNPSWIQLGVKYTF